MDQLTREAPLSPPVSRPASRAWRWCGRMAPAGASLAFLLGAAHFFRSGQQALSLCCLVWAGLLWRPAAWLRRSAACLLLALAVEWGGVTLFLIRLRRHLGQDWLRLACILGAVLLLTVLAALALRCRACRDREQEGPRAQAAACVLVTVLLLLLDGRQPDLLLLHRLWPGWGALEALLAGLWAGLVYGWLADRKRAPVWRRRIWLLFSCVFFAQLLAGLFLHSLFLLQGVPHLPVPGLVLSGPLYRGEGPFFMPLLFAVSLVLAGSAWCSHLCYLGVWDALAADTGPRTGRGLPRVWRTTRLILLVLSLLLPLGLRLAGLPWPWALVLALALGLAVLPCALWLSRRLGLPVYCCAICPLGMAGNVLARLSPWRLRRNRHCRQCGACARICRYGALRLEDGTGVTGPDWRCVLCRDCLSVCRHGALEVSCCGWTGPWAEQGLILSLSVLHTLFLFLGRV